MARDPIEIFRQLGLADGDGCLTRTFAGQIGTSVVEVRDAVSGGMPDAASSAFEVRLINPDLAPDWKGARWLELPRAGLADAVAAVIGDASSFVVGDGDWPPEALAFADDDTAYFNAFADQQYGDWRGDRDGRGVLVLRDPRETYGSLYEEWLASVMALADRGELGPLVESAYAGYAAPAAAPRAG